MLPSILAHPSLGRRIKRVLLDFNTDKELKPTQDQKEVGMTNEPNVISYRRQTIEKAQGMAEKGKLILALNGLVAKAQTLRKQLQDEMVKDQRPIDPQDLLYLYEKLKKYPCI